MILTLIVCRRIPQYYNLEAELLRAGVHRGRLAHTRRSCNQNGVAQRLPSITLCLSLALEVSTVPHICTPGKLEVFQPKERRMGIFMKTIIVKLKFSLFRLPKVKQNIPLPSSRFFSSCVLLSSRTALCFHLFNQLNKKKDKTDIEEKDKVVVLFFVFYRVQGQIIGGSVRACHLCSFFTEAVLLMTSLEC